MNKVPLDPHDSKLNERIMLLSSEKIEEEIDKVLTKHAQLSVTLTDQEKAIERTHNALEDQRTLLRFLHSELSTRDRITRSV